MEALPSLEMQDYWNEVRTLRAAKKDSLSEEDKSHDDLDEGDLDTTFFESLGMSVSNSSQELSEATVNTNTFMGTLTTRQEEVLKRRVQTLNATLRQKRHRSKPAKPDIRSFFSSNDASSTGTRSRSATPDSLDSVSPPHTPPDPDPKAWVDPYLSRSRGSLDSGNHSLVTIPCYQPSSPTLVTVSSLPPSTSLVTVTNYQPASAYENRSTSIVTVSNYSNGSTSPFSSDTNDGSNVHSRYINETDKYSNNDGQRTEEINNKYKYSRTYISQDDHSNGDYSYTTLKNDNNQRDNMYTSNSGYCSSKKYVQSKNRNYSGSRNKENSQQYSEECSGYRRPDKIQQLSDNSTYRISESIQQHSDNGTYRRTESIQQHPINSNYRRIDSTTQHADTSKYRRPISPEFEGNVSLEDWEPTIRQTGQHRYVHYPEGRLTALPRAPSLDTLAKDSTDGSPRKPGSNVRRQRSYARDLAKDVKLYYTKGAYELKPQSYYCEEGQRDVQVLRYQPIGSMHIPRCREGRPPLTPEPPREENQEEVSSAESGAGHTISKSPPSQPCTVQTGRPRSSSTTDLGFKAVYSEVDDKFPELLLEVGRSGQTRMDWLHETDLQKLKALALLELDIIFADHNISHSWRQAKKKKIKEADHGVFGVSLATLLERDSTHLADPCALLAVPLIFSKLISHLELQGLQEEGILRIPANSSKTELLRASLDSNFYSTPAVSDAALRSAAPNELVAAIKLFLRMLPEPLLTRAYMAAFHKVHRIEQLEERVVALTMLLLLLPTPHRETLRALLDLCSKVVDHESINRMGLFNVATIMAPNLFPPKPAGGGKAKIKNEDKDQVLQYAHNSCELSQMLIKYRNVLWTVPHRLLGQIRRQYQAIRVPAPTHIARLLSRKPKEPPQNTDEEQGSLNCGVRVQTPQLTKQQHTIHTSHSFTVRELLDKFIEEESQRTNNRNQRVEGRREQAGTQRELHVPPSSAVRHPASNSSRGTWSAAQAPNSGVGNWAGGNAVTTGGTPALTCMLRGQKHALMTHALHERGGNIGDRRLDDSALLLAVHQDNPTGELVLKCHHPGGHVDYYKYP